MPYNPGVVDRSGEILAAGISQGFNNAAGVIDVFGNRAAKAKVLRKALELYDPEGKDKYAAMGLEDLEGAQTGLTMSKLKQQQDAQLQREEVETNLAKLRLATGQRQLAGDQNFDTAYANASNANPSLQLLSNSDLLDPQAQSIDAIKPGMFDQYAGQAPTQPSPEQLKRMIMQYGPSPDRVQQMNNLGMLREQTQIPEGFLPSQATVDGSGQVHTTFRPPVAQQPRMQIPENFAPTSASVDKNGNPTIKYGPKEDPKAKALTGEEVNRISSIKQANRDLDMLEQMYEGLGKDFGGPVSGRVKNLVSAGQNMNVNSLQNAITSATPNLARGVFREVGVLTDADVARYSSLLPGPYDTDEVRKSKFKQLRNQLKGSQSEIMSALESSGRNVKGFESTKKEGAKFKTEEEARSAGAQSGDKIMMYDPQTSTFRPYQLH